MSCPWCGHTMKQIGEGQGRLFWCARCGTVRDQGSHFDTDQTPKLVERCRQFARELSDEPGLMARWEALGVAESIHPPEDRE